MDLVGGGNLAVRYVFEGEDKAAWIVRQVVRALRYLHDRNIAHRDLKLDNILIEHEGPGAAVKLVDFGLSAIFEKDSVSSDILGSWNYVAPEVIRGKSRPAEADMWSLGVVAYFLLSGRHPFNDTTTERIKQRILAARYGFNGKAWTSATEDSKHFVRSLLQRNPRLRLTAAKAQEHRWLRPAEELSQTPPADQEFVESITRSILHFRDADPMKQLALEVVARTLDPTQVRQLAMEFDRADKTNDGEVSLAEFKNWMATCESARGMSEEDIEALFNSVDVDGTGLIHFNEFLAATIPHRSLDDTRLKAAFDRLDRSHTGLISVRDLTLMTGAAANAEESAVIMKEFDFKGDGQISFEEFVEGMRRIDSRTEASSLRTASSQGSTFSLPPPPPAPSTLATIGESHKAESTSDEETSSILAPARDVESDSDAPLDEASTPARVLSDEVAHALDTPSSPLPLTQVATPTVAPVSARTEPIADGGVGAACRDQSRLKAGMNSSTSECLETGGNVHKNNGIDEERTDAEAKKLMRRACRHLDSDEAEGGAKMGRILPPSARDQVQGNGEAVAAVASVERGITERVTGLPLGGGEKTPPVGCCTVT